MNFCRAESFEIRDVKLTPAKIKGQKCEINLRIRSVMMPPVMFMTQKT